MKIHILAGLLIAMPAHAALLRPFTQITAGTVHLGDLFDDLGNTPDRVLGHAPDPGARITVSAPQLAAIARDYNVDWRPATGAEQAVIERRGDQIAKTTIIAVLRDALLREGAPADCDIASPDLQPILVPSGAAVLPEISQLNYDVPTGHFTALLSVTAPQMPQTQIRMSGLVVAMVQASVAKHHLTTGSVLAADDIEIRRVRAGLLHNAQAIVPEKALGLSVKHDIPPGQPLVAADLVRPIIVARGSVVRMSLRSAGIELNAQGIAEEAAGFGDHIKVQNPVSHLMIDAEVTGPGEVRVAPRQATVTLVDAQ